MKDRSRIFAVLFGVPLVGLILAAASAGAGAAPGVAAETNRVQRAVDRALASALVRFADRKLLAEEVAITAVDVTDPRRPVAGGHRSEVQVYPASVVKLFYLVAVHRWMEDGRLADTPELRRAMRDMIVESYNEATHYVVDLLTETTSGPELTEAEIDLWAEKRNTVNRYFVSTGYTGINVNKKPWCEGPYGRETQSIRRHSPSRNLLTTAATARLMGEIATGRAVSAGRSREMMELLQRDPAKRPADSTEPDQGYDFSGPGLPPQTRLWSKAGWTSQTRHDAAYVELPDGRHLVLVTFTVGHANEREILPHLVREILAAR